MDRDTYWILTVRYWPHAAEAGVAPREARFTEILADDDPALYLAHEFAFRHPPTRDDFLAACKGLPWTAVWDQTLLPLLASHDWPLIDRMHRGASVGLRDDSGRVVGELTVWRHEMYRNEPYRTVALTCRVIDRAVNRLPAARREAARDLIRRRENRIREQFLGADDADDRAVVAALRRLLADHRAELHPPDPAATP